jgi:hypothetical protein
MKAIVCIVSAILAIGSVMGNNEPEARIGGLFFFGFISWYAYNSEKSDEEKKK